MPIDLLSVAGAKLRVRTGGSGARPVVFALDPPNILEHYAQTFIAWSKHARLVAFEPPGFGQSKRAKGFRYDIESFAALTEALLERLSLRGAVLAFPCVAAYPALRVAAKRPDLVAGLVLVQAPSWPQELAWAARVDKNGVLRTPIVGQAASVVRGEAIVRGWYRAATADPERAEHMAALAAEALEHGAGFPIAAVWQQLFRDADAAFDAPKCPVLCVWGARDRSHSKSDPASMRAHAPDADLVVIEDAGHFPELETPIRFRDEVVSWMARRDL